MAAAVNANTSVLGGRALCSRAGGSDITFPAEHRGRAQVWQRSWATGQHTMHGIDPVNVKKLNTNCACMSGCYAANCYVLSENNSLAPSPSILLSVSAFAPPLPGVPMALSQLVVVASV